MDICPACGGNLTKWHTDIYGCEDCDIMYPVEALKDIGGWD